VHDDPIVDAMKDPFGYLLVGAAAVMLVAAVR
jgi:hypothetical protein